MNFSFTHSKGLQYNYYSICRLSYRYRYKSCTVLCYSTLSLSFLFMTLTNNRYGIILVPVPLH